MEFAAAFQQGLTYEKFLAEHGTEDQQKRWGDLHAQVKLTEAQRALLASFKREIKVLCLAGAWCGDCVNQCPIFDHFAAASERVRMRYLDRDADPELAGRLAVCGGARVPVLVFLSEDDHFVASYGDRTLSKYRHMAELQLGPACPTGIGADLPLLQAVTQDWLDEFERVHLLLRTSPRLRKLHDD